MQAYKLFAFLFFIFLIPGLNFSLELKEKKLKNLWLLLLHYKGGKSVIKNKDFFLSPNGNINPEEELDYTIKLMKENPKLACKFPARAYFLKEFLKVNIETPRCPELEKFLREVDGEKVSLVFADYYINSPASMFGHTFIRIYKKENLLYSYILNYAARAEDINAFLYAFKGLTGLYDGYYSIAPYYIKIKEYTGMEGRDLWEYVLKTDEKYVKLLKFHIWEINERVSPYYFFFQNCSSETFYILNILYPEEMFKLRTPWVIPIDTVKYLYERNLIEKVVYRPSLITKLDALASFMKKKDIEEIKLWIKRENKSLPEGKPWYYYEFASNFLRINYIHKNIPKSIYKKKFIEVLRKRAKIKSKGKLVINPKQKPHISHKSQLVYMNTGLNDGKYYISLSYRPVYHGLLDPPIGYKRGFEIAFSETELRYFPKINKLVVEKWLPVKIISLEPIRAYYTPISWKVSFGFKRFITQTRKKGYAFLSPAGGYTFKLGGVRIFGLGGFHLLAQDLKNYPVGIYMNTGILYQGSHVSYITETKVGKYVTKFEKKSFSEFDTRVAYHLSLNTSVNLGVSLQKLGSKVYEGVEMEIRKYF